MTNSFKETQTDSLTPDFMSGILEESEAKEYKILSELSDKAKLKMELIEEIRHAGDRKTRREKIEKAAKKLGKSTRTIRRMVTKVEQDGLAALAETVRSDKGQLRTSLEWQERIIQLYNQKKRQLKKNNKNSNQKIEVNRHQIWKLIEAEARLSGLKEGEFPSHVTVYKVLEPLITKRKLRHPGQGARQFIQTTDGPLEITHSNPIFQCDHTDSDILLVDVEGNEIGRPYFTTIIDSYSGCIVGYHISLKKPGSHEVALAFRHAFLPKPEKYYRENYKLQKEWEVSGIPQYFVTDRAKEFKSAHLKQIAAQLGIELRLRAYPQQGGLVERPFGTINTEFLESMPGYTGSNIEKRPQNPEKEACLTLDELEQLLVRYIVDNYNQNPYPRAKNQTRASRWKSMLLEPLKAIDERELDICLLKSKQCKIQGKGTVLFKTNTYEGDCLRDRQCKCITLRYDPQNILRLMVYTKEENGQPARHLGVIQARDKTEPFSIWEQKAKKKKERDEGKQIDKTSIYAERLDRHKTAVKRKKQSKAENRQQEQNRIDNNRTGFNVAEFKDPTQDSDAKNTQQSKVSKKKLLSRKPVTFKSKSKKAEVKPARVAVANWDEFVKDNW